MWRAVGTDTLDGMGTCTATPDASGTPSPPRRRWRWWHTLLLLAVAPVVLFALWIGLVIVSLSGGFDDLFAGDPPRQGGPEVVAARNEAARELAADSARLTAAVVVPALGAAAAPVGRGEVTPSCQEGQHNWKIDDDFDLACDLDRVEVVAVAQRGAFHADMVALDAALRADGWTSDLFGMHRVLVDYWDPYGTTTPPQPGARPSMPNYPAGYTMDDLPSARYTKTADGQTRTLVVGWAEPGSPPHVVTYFEDWSTFRDIDGGKLEPGAIIDAIPADGYAVVVTESVEYFRR
jgi:hypothetical protein